MHQLVGPGVAIAPLIDQYAPDVVVRFFPWVSSQRLIAGLRQFDLLLLHHVLQRAWLRAAGRTTSAKQYGYN